MGCIQRQEYERGVIQWRGVQPEPQQMEHLQRHKYERYVLWLQQFRPSAERLADRQRHRYGRYVHVRLVVQPAAEPAAERRLGGRAGHDNEQHVQRQRHRRLVVQPGHFYVEYLRPLDLHEHVLQLPHRPALQSTKYTILLNKSN